jgi:hypothetical protein
VNKSSNDVIKNNNKSMSGDYYVVNYSTNDDTSSSSAASNNKEKVASGGAGKIIAHGRKKSEPETVKIEKVKSSSLPKKQDVPAKKQPVNITYILTQFFKKRPSADQLKQRGILQGTFFK